MLSPECQISSLVLFELLQQKYHKYYALSVTTYIIYKTDVLIGPSLKLVFAGGQFLLHSSVHNLILAFIFRTNQRMQFSTVGKMDIFIALQKENLSFPHFS